MKIYRNTTIHNILNKATHDANDTSDENSVIEIEPPKNDGDQNNGKQDKLLTTNFEVKVENQKWKGS